MRLLSSRIEECQKADDHDRREDENHREPEDHAHFYQCEVVNDIQRKEIQFACNTFREGKMKHEPIYEY